MLLIAYRLIYYILLLSHIKNKLRMIITGKYPNLRLRRNRQFEWSRRLIEESNLSVNDLILPIFITGGKNIKQPIKTKSP